MALFNLDDNEAETNHFPDTRGKLKFLNLSFSKVSKTISQQKTLLYFFSYYWYIKADQKIKFKDKERPFLEQSSFGFHIDI